MGQSGGMVFCVKYYVYFAVLATSKEQGLFISLLALSMMHFYYAEERNASGISL